MESRGTGLAGLAGDLGKKRIDRPDPLQNPTVGANLNTSRSSISLCSSMSSSSSSHIQSSFSFVHRQFIFPLSSLSPAPVLLANPLSVKKKKKKAYTLYSIPAIRKSPRGTICDLGRIHLEPPVSPLFLHRCDVHLPPLAVAIYSTR